MALHVNNLFDREYVASCFNTYGCFRARSAMLLATATFRFNHLPGAVRRAVLPVAAMQENFRTLIPRFR